MITIKYFVMSNIFRVVLCTIFIFGFNIFRRIGLREWRMSMREVHFYLLSFG